MFFPGGLALLAGGLLYEWADRKLLARFQNRIGPRWFQPLTDVVKLLSKEEVIPEGVNKFLFLMLPVMALAGALTAAPGDVQPLPARIDRGAVCADRRVRSGIQL